MIADIEECFDCKLLRIDDSKIMVNMGIEQCLIGDKKVMPIEMWLSQCDGGLHVE